MEDFSKKSFADVLFMQLYSFDGCEGLKVSVSDDVVSCKKSKRMAKFMLVYRDSVPAPTPPSPEEMQGFLALWGEWFQQCGASIVDGGDALAPTGRVLCAGGTVTDGPYIEGKEMLGGYSVVQADSYEAAVEIAKLCPIAKIGMQIEIREFAGYN